jgi:protein-S-isoprenylcysteine O-methyltransferase Ste14
MPPAYLPPLLLITLWAVAEAPMGRDPQRTKPSKLDRFTVRINTMLGYAGFVSSLAIAPWTRQQAPFGLPGWLAWAGILVMVLGTALRLWSMRSLGRFHTRTLQIQTDQVIIEAGPYRLLRHPSYLGGDIALLGIGITTGSRPSALLMVLPFVAAHVWRIRIEEQMMSARFGAQWAAYSKRTWRMVVFVW